MAAEDKYAIGLAVGMEYVDGVMMDDTSWTTAVLIKDGSETVQVSAKADELTVSNPFGIVEVVLKKILASINPASVTRINIATPQVLDDVLFDNHLDSRLTKVTAVRLCGSATQSLLPFSNISDKVKETLKGDICLLDGGYEYSRDPGANNPITPLNTTEVLQCIEDIGKSSVTNVAITGVYSPDCAEQEFQVGQLFKSQNSDLKVTLSHEVVNEIGLLERENTTILNAGLESSFKDLASKYKDTFQKLNLDAPFYFVQNDGSLVRGDDTDAQFPFAVKSFFAVDACNMNSCIVLEKDLKNCMVISIDGNKSTAGLIKDGDVELQTPIIDVAGFPIYKHAVATVSHNIGMFSKVHNPDSDSTVSIGPDSVVFATDSQVYGGRELTVLDAAAKKGLVTFPPNYVDRVKLTDDEVTRILSKFLSLIEILIDSTKESAADLPVVFIGVGNVMINENDPPPAGASKVIKPPNAEVAAAIGAAVLSETSLHFATTEYSPKTDPSEYLTHERHVFRQPRLRPRVQPSLKSPRKETRATKDDPHIDPDSHEWWLSELDLEYISVGAGILGSGGGGSPQLGKLMAIDQLDKGKKIRVKTADWMSDDGLAVITAIMGSPGVLIEKYPNGAEGGESIELMKDLYNCGYDITDGSLKWKPAGTVVQNTESGVTYVEDYPTVYNSPIASDPKFEAVMLIESGGLNTMQSLVVGAQMDLPVYDCDGQGRSVPNLDMIGPIMYGAPLYPCTLSGSKGQRVVALTSKTSKDVEEFFRIQTTKMGYFTAISFPPLKKDVVSNTMVHFTVSKAWRLGKAIAEAQGGDPIQKILDSENGIILIQGKVTSLSQENVEGFIVGRYVVSDGSKSVTIDYQNENLVAWSGPEGDPDSNDKVLAVTPDLICIVDSNGHPLNAEVLYFGVQLTVIAAPCSPLLKTETALQYIGPRAVGYNFDYKPIGGNPKYKPAEPVSPRKKQPRN